MKISKVLCYDDVLLVPKHFNGSSRKEIDLSTKVAGLELLLPILSANMPSVTGIELAIELVKLGGLPILHRMCSIEQQCEMVKEVYCKIDGPSSFQYIGASIGIGKDAIENAKKLINAKADIICIDVAHGDQYNVIKVAEHFRNEFDKFPLIVGNIATLNLIREFKNHPILGHYIKETAFKVGVGSGAACSTRIKSGAGLPTLESLFRIRDSANYHDYCIIADGGIKNSGDCVKSFGAGANAAMLGSILSKAKESPGWNEAFTEKKYYGNASSDGKKEANLGEDYIEGVTINVKESAKPLKDIIYSLKEGIQSGLSYCGSMNLEELYENAEFVKISSAGYKESFPHGLL